MYDTHENKEQHNLANIGIKQNYTASLHRRQYFSVCIEGSQRSILNESLCNVNLVQ